MQSGWPLLLTLETTERSVCDFCGLLPLDKQEQPILYHDSRQGVRSGWGLQRQAVHCHICLHPVCTGEGTGLFFSCSLSLCWRRRLEFRDVCFLEVDALNHFGMQTYIPKLTQVITTCGNLTHCDQYIYCDLSLPTFHYVLVRLFKFHKKTESSRTLHVSDQGLDC